MKQLQLPQLETPEMVGEGLPWHARANILVDAYNFQPTTVSEINVAFSGVIAFDKSPAKTGTHLQEVLLHQKTNPIVESPDRTVRAIVWGMGRYYQDASDRRTALRELFDTLDSDINPDLQVIDVAETEKLSGLGILSGIQHYAVREGITKKKTDTLQGGIKDLPSGRRLVTGYDTDSNDEIMIELLMRTLPADAQTTGGFKSLVLDAGKSQKARRDFWRAGLEKSRSHLIARPVVDNILKTNDVVS
jgi:hypothetical protein